MRRVPSRLCSCPNHSTHWNTQFGSARAVDGSLGETIEQGAVTREVHLPSSRSHLPCLRFVHNLRCRTNQTTTRRGITGARRGTLCAHRMRPVTTFVLRHLAARCLQMCLSPSSCSNSQSLPPLSVLRALRCRVRSRCVERAMCPRSRRTEGRRSWRLLRVEG